LVPSLDQWVGDFDAKQWPYLSGNAQVCSHCFRDTGLEDVTVQKGRPCVHLDIQGIYAVTEEDRYEAIFCMQRLCSQASKFNYGLEKRGRGTECRYLFGGLPVLKVEQATSVDDNGEGPSIINVFMTTRVLTQLLLPFANQRMMQDRLDNLWQGLCSNARKGRGCLTLVS
jgi:hypothetical protein